MKKTLYAVFDRKVKEFIMLREAVNIAEFKRWFILGFLDGYKSIFASFPDDYDVYALCDFSSETGRIDGNPEPKLILNVKDLVDDAEKVPQVAVNHTVTGAEKVG